MIPLRFIEAVSRLKPSTTIRALFQWHSLKIRVTVFTLTFFLIGIWLLAFYSNYTLKNDMEQALGEQQFSTVSIIAAEINTGLEDRIKALEKIASLITPAMMGNAAAIQTAIEDRIVLQMMYNGGIFVLSPDGTAIADYPLSTGRRGINFMDRKYAIGALKEGKATIGSPVMGKALRSTVLSIAVPIHNAMDEVIGALVGTIDLAKPNFISSITDTNYGKTGGYLLVAPKIRTIVFATDKKRIMEVLPALGVNPFIDKAIKGWEGSGVAITPSGVEVLTSIKGVPVAGWYVAGLMPTQEAFAPIRAMMWRMLLAAIFLTLLVGSLTWWTLRRQLAPVFSTLGMLTAMSNTDQGPQPLPITRQDEIGKLIGGFNKLLKTLGQREEALKESEAKFSNAFQTSPYAITITRAKDGNFVEVNDAFTLMTGFTREEALASSSIGLKMWVNEEDRQHVVAALSAGQPVVSEEYQFRTKNGQVIIGLFSAQVLHLSQGPCILSSINDITERKRMETTLQKSETSAKTLIENSFDVIFTLDANGTFFFVSPAWEWHFGHPVSEAIGKNFAAFVHPDDVGPCVEYLKTVLETGKPGASPEFRVKHADGSWRTFIANGSSYIDLEGQRQFMGTGRDITEHKKAEEEKAKLQVQLGQAQKMASIGLLAGGIAHDFNNILSPILGFAELLLEDIPDGDLHHARVMEIFNGAKRASALVKHILAFSRQSSPQRIVINPALVIKEVLSLARATIPTNLAIESDINADCGRIFADPTQLHQIVMNLITNAYHAIEEKVVGTIRVELQKEAPPATLAPGRYACLRVSDTGSGIDALALPRIFEPYFTTKPQGKGTGLGLSIIHGIVLEYGGDILVDSRLGEGTVFSVYLPLLENATEATVKNDRDHAKGTERILLVDDEEAIVRMETAMLERLGYHVTGHTTSVNALDAFTVDPQGFDLVITDMAMPLMTGLQLAQKLLAIRTDLPILMCTGFSDQIDKKIVLAQGLKGLLMKPLITGVLATELRRILDPPVNAQLGGCILVIDDEAPIRLLLRDKLSREGFEVLEAENGAQGLKICRQTRPDLVISDLVMPEKEGIQTIMEMKKEFPDLPVMAISGGGKSGFPDQYLQLAKQLGAQKVFAKPLDWPKLIEAVREILK